jgi:hypothetical protein
MTKNLQYDEFLKAAGELFNVDPNLKEYALSLCIEMAVRDLSKNLGQGLSSLTDRDLVITLEDHLTDGVQVSRIYLPDDCEWVTEINIENTAIEIVNDDGEFERQRREGLPNGGYISKFVSRIDGRSYLEIYPTITSLGYDISVEYRRRTKDISWIPDRYFNQLMYQTYYHWRLFQKTEDKDLTLIVKKESESYMGDVVKNSQGGKGHLLRPYEVEYKKARLSPGACRNDRDIRH